MPEKKDADPRSDPRSLCVPLAVGLWTIGCYYQAKSYAFWTKRAHEWDRPADWAQVSCNILATGVMCVEEDTGSTCGGYIAGSMPETNPPVFRTEQIATCPGTVWCALEEDDCSCVGEVLYAPDLFDGVRYTLDDTNEEFKVAAHGKVKCGYDQMGKRMRDPKPGYTKHCWCTPQGMLDILRAHNVSTLSKSKCADDANTDLKRVGESLKNDHDEGEQDNTNGRNFSSSGRRRRTFSYTPWALVEVSPPPKDVFDRRALLGPNRESSPTLGPRLRCAYEYGAPRESYQDYEGDGPYSGDTWKVEKIATDWGHEPERACWVRTTGLAAENGDECAVAMHPLGSLEKKRTQQTHNLWMGFCFWLVCTFISCGYPVRFFKHLRDQGPRVQPPGTAPAGMP